MKTTHNRKADEFTERLINVYTELKLLNALPNNKEFFITVKTTASNFANLQYGFRNYPLDLVRRKEVIVNLFDKYSVNPDYMNEKSDKMFLKIPDAAKVPLSDKALRKRKGVQDKLKDERDEYKTKYEEAEERIQRLEEELAAYKMIKKTDKANPKNPDKHPDK